MVAPERLQVMAVSDGAAPPWRRYGPMVVVGRGASGVVHVLAHLAWSSTADRPVTGQVIEEGERVGVVSRLNHLHWEIRRADRAPWPLATRAADTIDPLEWLQGGGGGSIFDGATRIARGVRDAVVSSAAGEVWVLAAILLAYGANSKRRR